MVVEHQQRAGENQRDVDVKRHAAHAPGVVVGHRVAIDFGRVKMQEDVGEHAQRTAARRLIVLHAEHRLPEVGLLGLLEGFQFVDGAFAHHLAAFEQRGHLAFAVLAVTGSAGGRSIGGRGRSVLSFRFSHDSPSNKLAQNGARPRRHHPASSILYWRRGHPPLCAQTLRRMAPSSPNCERSPLGHR